MDKSLFPRVLRGDKEKGCLLLHMDLLSIKYSTLIFIESHSG